MEPFGNRILRGVIAPKQMSELHTVMPVLNRVVRALDHRNVSLSVKLYFFRPSVLPKLANRSAISGASIRTSPRLGRESKTAAPDRSSTLAGDGSESNSSPLLYPRRSA